MSLSTFYLVTSDGITFFCKLQILTFHLCFEPKGLLTASNTRHQCKGFVVRFDFVRNQQRQIIVTSHDLGPQLVVFHKGNFRKKIREIQVGAFGQKLGDFMEGIKQV